MKTIQQIMIETPDSITSTDNPIFETVGYRVVHKDYEGEVKTPTGVEIKTGNFIDVPIGTKLRLLACNLQSDKSPFRYKGMDIYLDNPFIIYISGELGERYREDYETIV